MKRTCLLLLTAVICIMSLSSCATTLPTRFDAFATGVENNSENYSLRKWERKNAKFILADSTIAAIRKLKDGNGNYIWQPALVAGEPDRLLGYEVLTSAYMPTLAAGAKTIAFGDFSYYNIGDRGTRSFAELKELFAGHGMVGFIAKERVDGKLVLPEAIKVLQQKAS